MACRLLFSSLSVAWLPGCQSAGSFSEETAALNPTISNDQQYNDTTGTSGTYSSAGVVSTTSPFFASLGSNGRTCFSCHQFDQGWTITPAAVQTRFDSTAGSDPLFASVDGTNSPLADVSTLAAKSAATTMLRQKGLIRVGLPIPAGAEFTLSAVDDPYGFASAAQLSLFRRPLPTTNVRFLTTVMWDGRENVAGQSIDADLLHQANTATLTHAQAATSLTAAEERAIVDFMEGLYTAQIKDQDAKDVASMGSVGGPDYLATVSFYIGINDLLGDSQTRAAFNPIVFSLYDQWATTQTGTGDKEKARLSMLRGQTLFNTKPIQITGVAGLNDSPTFGRRPYSPAPAPPVTTRPTSATTRSRCRSTSASPTGRAARPTCRSTRSATTPPARRSRPPTPAAPWSPASGPTSASSRAPSCAASPRGPLLPQRLRRRPPRRRQLLQTRFGIPFTPQETTDLLMFLRSL